MVWALRAWLSVVPQLEDCILGESHAWCFGADDDGTGCVMSHLGASWSEEVSLCVGGRVLHVGAPLSYHLLCLLELRLSKRILGRHCVSGCFAAQDGYFAAFALSLWRILCYPCYLFGGCFASAVVSSLARRHHSLSGCLYESHEDALLPLVHYMNPTRKYLK